MTSTTIRTRPRAPREPSATELCSLWSWRETTGTQIRVRRRHRWALAAARVRAQRRMVGDLRWVRAPTARAHRGFISAPLSLLLSFEQLPATEFAPEIPA